MAVKKKQLGCPNCERSEKRLSKLETKSGTVKHELVKAKKNSFNSSKTSSGDIVNPAPKQDTALFESAPARSLIAIQDTS